MIRGNCVPVRLHNLKPEHIAVEPERGCHVEYLKERRHALNMDCHSNLRLVSWSNCNSALLASRVTIRRNVLSILSYAFLILSALGIGMMRADERCCSMLRKP